MAEEALRLAGEANVAGKVVLDTTNPLADAPPVDGVLALFTGPNESLMERLQAAFPRVRFVKAFSCVGNAKMVDPQFEGGKPTMFLCGNDAEARGTAVAIVERFCWEPLDLGTARAARAFEPLVQLWCLPGFQGKSWTHAFKVLWR